MARRRHGPTSSCHFTLFGERLELTAELLRVAGAASPASPASTSRSRCFTDSTYREEFLGSSPARCVELRGARRTSKLLRACGRGADERTPSATMVPGYRHVARQPLRLDRASQPARLPRRSRSPRRWRFGLGAGACFYYVADRRTARRRGSPTGGPRASRSSSSSSRTRPSSCRPSTARRRAGRRRGQRRRGPPGDPPHRPLLPRPLRQLRPLPRPRGGPRRLRRRGRLPLRHRLRGAPDDLARAPGRGSPRPASGVPARRPHVHGPGGLEVERPRRRAIRRGDRASRAADDRAAAGRLRGAAGAAPVRGRGRQLAARSIEDWQWCARFNYQVIERRGTGRRQLPAHVLAVPRGSRDTARPRSPRRRPPVDRAGRGVEGGQ